MIISLNDLYVRMTRLVISYNAMQCEAIQSIFIKQHVIPVCVSEATIRVRQPSDVNIDMLNPQNTSSWWRLRWSNKKEDVQVCLHEYRIIICILLNPRKDRPSKMCSESKSPNKNVHLKPKKRYSGSKKYSVIRAMQLLFKM